MKKIIPLKKIKALLLYFCENTNHKYLGKTKLMKLFYFIDFLHVKKYGFPITNDNYVNLEHGPIPSVIKNLVDQVDEDSENATLADTILLEKNGGQSIHRVTPQKKLSTSEMNFFSDTELEVINYVCKKYGDYSTRAIEEESHKEAPWAKTTFLSEIPYTLAAQDLDCKVSVEEIEMLAKISEQ